MAQKAIKKKRRTVIWIAVLLCVCAGVGVGLHVLANRGKRYALEQISAAVHEQTGGIYRFSVGKLSVKLLSGELVVRDFAVTPDSTAIDSLTRAGHPPRLVVDGSVRELRVHVKYSRDLRRGKLDIRRITIEGPALSIVRDSTSRPTEEKPRFRSPFRSITIGQIAVRHGSFSYERHRAGDTLRHRLGGVSLHVERLVLDSVLNLKEFVLPAIDNLRCEVEHAYHAPAGEALELSILHVKADLAVRRLEIDSLRLIPRYGKQEFTMRTLSRTDWMRLEAPRITVAGLDFAQLLGGGGFTADSVTVAGGKVESYKNRQAVVPQREKPLFQQLLQRVQMPVRVGVVAVDGFGAVYEELPVKGFLAGKLTMTDISARIDSLTNDASLRKHFTLRASGRMMDRGKLDVTMKVPVEKGDDHFSLRATLHALSIDAFNPMIEPLAHLSVRAGRVQRLDVTLQGDAVHGTGEMRFTYDSLRVDVLNKIGLRSWAGSLLVNDFVIVRSNPLPGKEVRTVQCEAARNPYRSNFNYLWRICFDGIKQSAGLTEKKQAQFEKIKTQLEERKQRRAERKERKNAR